MKLLNWHSLLTLWRNRVASSPTGSFLDTGLGGRVERRASGWFQLASAEAKWKRIDEESAAVCLAARNFALVKQSRSVLPLP